MPGTVARARARVRAKGLCQGQLLGLGLEPGGYARDSS